MMGFWTKNKIYDIYFSTKFNLLQSKYQIS